MLWVCVTQRSQVSYTVTADMVNPCDPLWWGGGGLRNTLGVAWRRDAQGPRSIRFCMLSDFPLGQVIQLL